MLLNGDEGFMEPSASSIEQPAAATAEEPKCISEDPGSSTNDEELRSISRGPIHTSTPTRCPIAGKTGQFHIRSSDDSASGLSVTRDVDSIEPDSSKDFVPIKIPILGYETLEEREKFTLFKLEVRKNSFESWFIFRRYSDFARLKRQLKRIFPDVHLLLPPKKYFGGNFETEFLDERMAGLQNFIDFIIMNKQINSSNPVKQFFCYDEPPGPYESLEESRALCESLEDQVYRLTAQLQERDEKIRRLEAELEVNNERIAMMKESNYHSCSCVRTMKASRDTGSKENLKLLHNSFS